MGIFSKIQPMRKFLIRALFVFLLLFNVLLPTRFVHADIWGAAFAATLLDQVITTIKVQIEGAILGTLKVAAITMLNSKVGQMVGGKSAGSAMVISDWNEFLYTAPAEKVTLYMNDFFSTVTRGKFSSANYVGVGDTIGAVDGNYVNYLVVASQQAIRPMDVALEQDSAMSFNLDEFTDSPEAMFAYGDFRALNAFTENPFNSPYGVVMIAEGVHAKKMEEEKKVAEVKSQSSGFKAPEVDGKTVAPAATIESMVADTQNIGNQLIAAAKNPGEFLSGVVGALVNKAVTNMVQRGVGKLQANIKREIGKYDTKVTNALNKADKQLGPAAKYLKGVSQRVDTNVKPYTKPPPDAGGYCDGGC
jgi:hypothetical protein